MATLRGDNLDNEILGTIDADSINGAGGNDSLYGGDGGDVISGGAGDDILWGEAGDDTLNAGDGNDSAFGGDGNDLLNGSTGNDLLDGGNGNDLINGGLGADIMVGGDGNDTYSVDDIGDTVTEAADGGRDLVLSTVDFDLRLYANVESLKLNGTAVNGWGNDLDNSLVGNDVANTLDGGAGADTLDGGLGGDAMTGGFGNDVYYVNDVLDTVTEGAAAGTDLVKSSVSFTLGTNVENLTLTGVDAISGTGNGDANIITGNSAANTLGGGNGNDTLIGGAGNDSLNGNNGNDYYFLEAVGSGGVDQITNFSHNNDKLAFHAADYGFSIGQSLGAGQFTAGTTASGSLAQFVWDAAGKTLYWDADGNGAGAKVAIVTFSGSAAGLTATDFLFLA